MQLIVDSMLWTLQRVNANAHMIGFVDVMVVGAVAGVGLAGGGLCLSVPELHHGFVRLGVLLLP